MRLGGTINGTGATLYMCIGFVPDWARIFNFETVNHYEIHWNRQMMRSSEFVEGMQFHTGTTYRQITALTKGAGILPFFGGKVLGAADVGNTAYGEGVYLKPDNRDYRYVQAESPHDAGDAVAVTIDKWTLDTLENNPGHFNEDVVGTYIGEGSMICIDGRWYSAVALTAGQGEAADEVTLSHPVLSGKVEFIGGKYSLRPMIAGEVAKDGFVIANNTVNANDALIGFECGKYDW